MRAGSGACSTALLLLATLSCAGGASETRDSNTPARVVVLAPAAAEMLSALDVLDRVVAVGEFGPWPGALVDLPVAGGYASPNVEIVLTLGADAVITTRSVAARDSHRRLEELGVRVVALETDNYEGVFASLLRLGTLFDRSDRARQVERKLRTELREIELAAAALPRRRVLFVVGRDPLYVAGPGSHIDQMITAAGGENVAADVLAPYQQMSLESVLERMPEVIVDTSNNGPGALRGRKTGEWARWEFVPAVETNRVHQIDPSQLVIPGMRLPDMTRLMAQLIHPETFGDPEPDRYGPVLSTTPLEDDATAP